MLASSTQPEDAVRHPAPMPGTAVFDAVTTALAEAQTLDDLLERVLDVVLRIAGVDGGGIWLVDEQTQDLGLAVHRGVGKALVASFAADPGPELRKIVSTADVAVMSRDLSEVSTHYPELAAEGICAFAAIPLIVHGKSVGLLTAVSHELSSFNPPPAELLVSVGRHIGLAIDRVRLLERERRRARQFETIGEVGRRLGALHHEGEILPQIVHYVREHLGYEAANVLLLDEQGGEFVLAAASGLGNELLVGQRLPVSVNSIAGWVITHNEPLLANDVSREPRHYRAGSCEQAELAVPVQAGSRILGVLDVQSARVNAFSEMDIAVLQILAGQIAVAIENARLYEAMEQSLRRAHAFQEVTAAITATLDVPTVLRQTLDCAMEVFGADRAAFYLIVPGTRQMYCAASRNLSDSYIEAVTHYYGSTEWPEVFDHERSVFVEDAQASHLTPALMEAVRREGIRSMLYLPLPNGRERLGTLVLYHDRVRRYSNEEIGLARTFADQANIAIQHANLFEAERKAREQAATILEATRAVTSTLQVEDVLTQAASAIAASLRQRVCGVWLLNAEETALTPVFRAGSGRRDAALDRLYRQLPSIPVDAAPRIQALVRDGTPYIAYPGTLTEPELAVQRILPYHHYIAIPLAARDRVLGVAAVPYSRPDQTIDAADIEAAMAIARSTALALENARLYEQSQQLAVSEERNRLARELHDSVTHALFSMTLITQALPRLLDRDPARARERLERLNDLGRGALAEMRALIFELRPAALEEHGLADALRRHTAAFESRESIKVELTIAGERRMPLTVEEHLFRIAQEALNNVAKHAAASSVTVTLTIEDAQVTLVIEDNGRGFEPSPQPTERRGMGVTGMHERAAILGGDCIVMSEPGAGTTVHVHVPLTVNG